MTTRRGAVALVLPVLLVAASCTGSDGVDADDDDAARVPVGTVRVESSSVLLLDDPDELDREPLLDGERLELPTPSGVVHVAVSRARDTVPVDHGAREDADPVVAPGAEARAVAWVVVPDPRLAGLHPSVTPSAWSLALHADDVRLPLAAGRDRPVDDEPRIHHVVVPAGVRLAVGLDYEGDRQVVPVVPEPEDHALDNDEMSAAARYDDAEQRRGRCRVTSGPRRPAAIALESTVTDVPWWPGLGWGVWRRVEVGWTAGGLPHHDWTRPRLRLLPDRVARDLDVVRDAAGRAVGVAATYAVRLDEPAEVRLVLTTLDRPGASARSAVPTRRGLTCS